MDMAEIGHFFIVIMGVAGRMARQDARNGVKDDVVDRRHLAGQGKALFGGKALLGGLLEPAAQAEHVAGVEAAVQGQLGHRGQRGLHGAGDHFSDVAVLFGGATALLPAFVHTVLKLPPGTEEIAFGWLRAAPGMGAVITFIVIANKPLKTKPGPKLLFCVAGFGASIIIFGLSRSFLLSMAMLILSGAFDAVSVVIRGTILQVYTPDAVRGRVAAVNTMFVSSSNELGEVESGFTAKWMGTVPAVIFGGCMTLVVAGITWFSAPKMRSLKLEPPEENNDQQ